MSLNIPRRYEPQIQEIANAQHISTAEALDRVIQAGLERLVPKVEETTGTAVEPKRSYASFFGVIKGPGAHGSREAIDRYIAELRNEW